MDKYYIVTAQGEGYVAERIESLAAKERELQEAKVGYGVFKTDGPNHCTRDKLVADWEPKSWSASLEQKAMNGDTDAQVEVGECYFYGYGITQNYRRAFELYEKASTSGNLFAEFMVGRCYYEGKGVPEDVQKGVSIHMGLIDKHQPDAECYIGKQIYAKKDMASFGFKFLHSAANSGHAEAQGLLGDCYSNGLGTITDKSEARKWYIKSAEQGDHNGLFGLACLMQEEAASSGDGQLIGQSIQLLYESAIREDKYAKQVLHDLATKAKIPQAIELDNKL